jgi:TonB-linked SusC/RagA family outer membrane protein
MKKIRITGRKIPSFWNKSLRLMKLTFLFLVVGLMQLSASVYSQTTKLSLEMRNAKVAEVLDAIEKQSEFRFAYSPGLIDLNREVTVDIHNKTIDESLIVLFKGTSVEFGVYDRHIILYPEEMEAAENHVKTLIASYQQRTVSGRVTDSRNQPLPGVTVVLKGTTQGTVTNANGNYSFNNVPEDAILVFSFVGMRPQEVVVGTRQEIDIRMEEETFGIEEVVAIGYGTMKKSDLTGSVSSIKSEDIERSPVTSFDQAIQGKAAGVQVTQASSAPGGRVSIRIRGGNSLSSSNEPLYIVDGFPISAGNSAGGNGVGQNPLATISPSDIASIEILKDASATAIYGSRGANGVVLITTKRGEIGKPKVTLDTYYGVQSIAKKLDMMNAEEYALLVNEARANDGQSQVFPNPDNLYYFPDPGSLGAGVDYQDEVFTNAPVQNYNVGISGGNEGIRYNVGGSYFGQDGIIKNSDFNRASFRSNLDIKILPNLTVNTNITASHIWANGMPSEGDGGGGTGGIVHGAITMPPSVPIFDAEGNYTKTNPTPGGTPTSNPVATANHYKDENKIDRVLGSFDVNWEIINNLTLKVTFGTDMSSANRAFYWPKETDRGNSRNGEGYQRYRNDASYLNENILSYIKDFGDHSLNATAGYTWQVFHYKAFNAGSTNYTTDLYQANNLGAGTTYSSPGSDKTQSQLASYLGRINYIYKNRYLFTFTARADGSSKFGVNNKWAFFPSFALAWRFSEEDFMESADWLSNLKFRASYGTTGNQNISSYRSLAMLGTRNYPLGNELVSGIGPNNIPNPNLKWETTATTDFGFDMGVFENRLSVVFDYYYKKTTDLLWNISTPSSSGFNSIFKNIGSLENKGVEIALGANIFEGDFKWDTQLNWSKNKNKVLEIPGYTPSVQGTISGHLKVNGSWLEPGMPVGVWNLLKYDGVFQDQAQLDAGPRSSSSDQLGDARFIDKNKDGKINYTDDRMIVGDPNPDFIYGMTNNFSYKGFDFSLYIQGSQGNDILNIQRAETNISGPWGNQRREILNRWTPTNTNTSVPRARVTVDPLMIQSDWLIEDGSYMRVKTMSLGYTFNKTKALSSLRLYVSGQNLITFTNYSGFDPEVNSTGNSNLQLGVDYNAYPSAKTVLFGINATF